MSKNHGIQGPMKGVQEQLAILERLHDKEVSRAYRRGVDEGLWSAWNIAQQIARMDWKETADAFDNMTLEGVIQNNGYAEANEKLCKWINRRNMEGWLKEHEERCCHNCMHFLRSQPEVDGDNYDLCMAGVIGEEVSPKLIKNCGKWEPKEDRIRVAKEEASCVNCASCVWYAKDDGEITYLCLTGQPEKSVRVTLPGCICARWLPK